MKSIRVKGKMIRYPDHMDKVVKAAIERDEDLPVSLKLIHDIDSIDVTIPRDVRYAEKLQCEIDESKSK